jgi:hypothetical protein
MCEDTESGIQVESGILMFCDQGARLLSAEFEDGVGASGSWIPDPRMGEDQDLERADARLTSSLHTSGAYLLVASALVRPRQLHLPDLFALQ